MVKLKNFLYCAGTRNEVRKSGEPPVTVVDGLLNALTPDFIPGNYSFSVVFSILNLQRDEDYVVRLSLKRTMWHWTATLKTRSTSRTSILAIMYV